MLSLSVHGAGSGAATIVVHFSSDLPKALTAAQRPRLSPSVAGSWTEVGTSTLKFTPTGVYSPGQKVTVTVPLALRSATGTYLKKPYVASYTVGAYSKLRLLQLLAQQGYLPVKFIASKADKKLTHGNLAEQRKLAFTAAAGKFKFTSSGWPAYLHWLWWNDRGVVLNGAIRALEYQHGMTMDGAVGPQVWSVLLHMAAANRTNGRGYTYAIASKTGSETLTIWHLGRVVLRSPANTGIASRPTADGTYPVFSKLQSQVMKGTNPDGSAYADQVYWVSYFNGGDAVHYFDRASYGWPQSLGCVELPWGAAETSFGYLSYGSLVSVVG